MTAVLPAFCLIPVMYLPGVIVSIRSCRLRAANVPDWVKPIASYLRQYGVVMAFLLFSV